MRHLLGTALAALLTLATGLSLAVVTAPAAHAAGPTSVAFEGLGFGHGWGLSQYGARNRADAGHSAREILDFYYAGTARGSVGGKIKVLITGDRSSNVVVGHRSGLTVKSLKNGKVWKLRKRTARRWRITSVGTRKSRLSVRSTGKWRHVRTIPGEAEFRAARNAPIRLYKSNGSAIFRGALRSAVPSSGRGRDTVNVISLESYLRGVVPLEMPALWHPNAVRAQAVAARTFAAHERQTKGRGYFDVYDTTSSQVYGGARAEHSASDSAIRATRREIRTYGGQPALTQFGSSNGGWTATGDKPYQVAKQDPFDPKPSWKVTVRAADIESKWDIGDFLGFEDVKRDSGATSHISSLTIVGSKGRARDVSGEELRGALNLRSSLFTKGL